MGVSKHVQLSRIVFRDQASRTRHRHECCRYCPGLTRSNLMPEMFCRIRAESFGPLVERVFHWVGDDNAVLDNAGRGSRCSQVLGRFKACLVDLSQSQQLCPLLGVTRKSISGDWRVAVGGQVTPLPKLQSQFPGAPDQRARVQPRCLTAFLGPSSLRSACR